MTKVPVRFIVGRIINALKRTNEKIRASGTCYEYAVILPCLPMDKLLIPLQWLLILQAKCVCVCEFVGKCSIV